MLDTTHTGDYHNAMAERYWFQKPRNTAPKEMLGTPLTRREREVLQHLSEGHTYKSVGVIMDISFHTVQFHLVNAAKKLGADNSTHAVALAIRGGVL